MGAVITVGIPAYKAADTIDVCLSSIIIQTIADKIDVIVASDEPDYSYSYLEDSYADYFNSIKTLETDENTGPGLARQRCLDACQTPWITFIDADDVFASTNSIESLMANIISSEVIEVQGTFLQQITNPATGFHAFIPHADIQHPWVFGRAYNVKFLKDNKISFSELRAMEDGEFNWKIRMSIDGTRFKIVPIQEPVYIWREGSEHSITRTGMDEKGIPQYNFDLCPVGSTIASIRAAKFCKKRNPFNGGITRFIVEMMIGQYFTYIECKEKKPIFADQCWFNAKRFYHECYSEVEKDITDDILKTMYTAQYAAKSKDLIGIIPEITFFDFIKKIYNDVYGGEEELKKIREKLPQEIIENDIKTGVSIF